MKVIEKFFKLLDKIAYALSAASIAGMLVCVFLQVVARIFHFSINWTTEMSQYFFLWSTTFASYVAARRKKLIGVELIQKAMPPIVRRLMKVFSNAVGAFFYVLVDYYCLLQMPKLMRQTTPVLKWPMGMIYYIMMAGLLMLALYFLYMAVLCLIEKEETKPQAPKTAAQIAEEVE